MPKHKPLKVGDKIIIYRKIKWNGWTYAMNDAVNHSFIIQEIIPDDLYNSKYVGVTLHGLLYYFPYSSIKRA